MKTKMTNAERVRKNAARNNALAAKRLPSITIEEARNNAVSGAKQGEAACRVYAMALRSAHGPRFYVLLDMEPATENEKEGRKALLAERKACRDRALERGLSNINKPWSDMLKCARELDNPTGETRDRKPLTQRVREGCTNLYKAIGKAEISELPKGTQETLLTAQRALADAMAAFGVDIAAINAKL